MIKRTTFTLVACITLLSGASLFYADAKQLKICVVETQQIMQKSLFAKHAQEVLQEEQARLAAPLMEEESSIRKSEQELMQAKTAIDKEIGDVNNSKILSNDAKQRKMDDLKDKYADLESSRQELEARVKKLQASSKRIEEKLSQTYQRLIKEIEQQLKVIIAQLSKVHGWDIVIPSDIVLAFSDVVNVTDSIIEAADAEFKKQEEAAKPKSTAKSK